MSIEERHKGEQFGCAPINPKACQGCIFASGPAPFADGPRKAYCRIFTREAMQSKPDSVYHWGQPCPYREGETEE